MYHSRFKGEHYQIGFKWGRNLLKHKQLFLTNVPFEITLEHYDFALQCLPIYQKFFPEIIEEIRGIADGQKCSFKSICAVLLSMYCIVPEVHCSCFAFRNENEILFGRNSDFLTKIEKLYTNCIYQFTNDSYAFNGNTTACVEMEDGINEYGLAIGLTVVYPTVKQLGLNAGMMLRLFLEKCKTVDEVIQLLNTLPIASSQTFTLVDTGGDIALIECNSKQIKINRNNQNAFATNWFFSEAMREYNNHLIDNWQAQKRYQTIKEAILTDKINDFNDAAALLSGRYGYICQYDRKTGKDTVWSVIYDVKNKRIFRVEGNPSRKSFMEDKRFKFK